MWYNKIALKYDEFSVSARCFYLGVPRYTHTGVTIEHLYARNKKVYRGLPGGVRERNMAQLFYTILHSVTYNVLFRPKFLKMLGSSCLCELEEQFKQEHNAFAALKKKTDAQFFNELLSGVEVVKATAEGGVLEIRRLERCAVKWP